MVRQISFGDNRISIWVFVMIVLLAMAAGIALADCQPIEFTKIWRSEESHANEKHGADAYDIRKCLKDNGPYQVWRKMDSNGFPLFFELCKLNDGRWGAVLKDVEGIERTAFVPSTGAWVKVVNYLMKNGFSRFTGNLPY